MSIALTGLLSNQGEKSINLFFHKGSFNEKKHYNYTVWYSKAQINTLGLGYNTPV